MSFRGILMVSLSVVTGEILPVRGSAITRWRSPVQMERKIRNWWFLSDFAVVLGTVVSAQVVRFGEHFSSRVALLVSELLSGLGDHRRGVDGHSGHLRNPVHGILGNGLEETRRVLASTVSVFGVMAVFSMIFQVDIARDTWRWHCRRV